MTPLEFEISTGKLFAKEMKKQLKRNIKVHHQKNYTSLTGNTYNVDLSYSFQVMGINYLTLVECKYWNTRVKRDVLCTLKGVVDDLHAHMGIVVSRRGFQRGAIHYARSHNITLIQLDENNNVDIIVVSISEQFSTILAILQSIFKCQNIFEEIIMLDTSFNLCRN